MTQIEFSPCGTKLFSVVRRNNEFLCWDLRNPGIVLYSLEGRQSDTNQRIQFDIMHNGKEIVSGMLMLECYIIAKIFFHFKSFRWYKWRHYNLGVTRKYKL